MSAPPDRNRVRELFEAACDLPQLERARYLDDACPGDSAVRAEVESLLGFDAATDDLLAEPSLNRGAGFGPHGDAHIGSVVSPPVPERVGKFRILRRIGAGGMGDVYEAEQDEPRRRVALKVTSAGGSLDIARRMRREGHIQARLNHPGIVQIYESGVHEHAGTLIPYFAMELAEGEPVTEACARRDMGVRERVAVMIGVCDAVSHAHQHGVIHRDLKPDNILIVATPNGPAPKVLDFGIAKLTGAEVPAVTTNTQAGHIVGTLAYMSPEQVCGAAELVDTRSDVYALGLILYELLLGKPARMTAGLSLPAAVRLIAENDPPRLGSLRADLRGDVETIVHKALARERIQRYAAVSELGADLRRFLNNEPISAHPPSATYLFRKFVGRNRALAAAAAAILMLLTASSVVTTALAISRSRALALSTTRAAEAVAAQMDAESISAFIESTLASVAPAVAQGQDTTLLRSALDRTAARVRAELDTHPLVLARLLTTIGATYRELGEFDSASTALTDAIEVRREMLGLDDPLTLRTAHETAVLLQEQSRFPEALELARDTLSRRERVLGPDHPDALDSASVVGAILDRQESAEATPVLKSCAERMERALGRGDERTINVLITLAAAYEREHRADEALALKTDILARCEAALGKDHPLTMTSTNNLAILLERLGRPSEAGPLYESALAARRRVLGDAHPQTQNSLVNVAGFYARNGDSQRALPFASEALAASRRTLAPGHFRIGHTLQVQGLALLKLGRFSDAEAALLEARGIFEANYGAAGSRTLAVAGLLADLYAAWEIQSPGHGHEQRAAQWRKTAHPDAHIAPAPNAANGEHP